MAAVPVTRTFVAGEVVLASYFNTNIRDVLNYLLAPPILEIEQIVSQTLANGTFTALTFTSESVDSSGMHSTSVNTSRATAVYPGYYRTDGAHGSVANATGSRYTSLGRNGTILSASQTNQLSNGGTLNTVTGARSKLIYLGVGDYAEIFGWQNSGGNLGTIGSGGDESSLSMKWDSN